MQELLEYLKGKNAELAYDSECFAHIRINGYTDHHRAAYMAARCENYLPEKAILFETTECGTGDDDFRVAIYDGNGSGVRDCVAHEFGGSILNRWWYGYVKGREPFWFGLNEGVKPEQIVEYLKKFFEEG